MNKNLLRLGSAYCSTHLGTIVVLAVMATPLSALAVGAGSKLKADATVTVQTAQAIEVDRAYEAVVASGQQQLDARDYAGALATFEQAIAAYPDAPRLLVGKGEALYGLSRFEEAAAAFGMATELAPDYLYAWVWLGNAYDDSKQLDLALEAYSTASRLDTAHPMPYYHRGIALWYAGRDAEAEADFRKTLKIIPDFPNAWLWLGRSLGQQAQYEDALAAFDQALTIDPDQQGSIFGRGRALLELTRYEEAIAAFDTYLREDSGSAPAWFYRGNGLLGLTQYEEALSAYERSLELQSESEGVFYNMGLVLMNLERYDEAIAAFEQVIAINPENDAAREQIESLKQLQAQARLSATLAVQI